MVAILLSRSGAAMTDSRAHALQAESKMGKDLSTGNLKSHLQHNHRVEFQVCCVCERASLVSLRFCTECAIRNFIS